MNKKLIKDRLNEAPLDEYEKELKDFLDRGDFVRGEDFKANKKMLEEAAKNFTELQQTKSVTLRVSKKDLIRIKARAKRSNLPYQTLINLLINNYAEGKSKLVI